MREGKMFLEKKVERLAKDDENNARDSFLVVEVCFDFVHRV